MKATCLAHSHVGHRGDCTYCEYEELRSEVDEYRRLACRIAQAADTHLYGIPDQHSAEGLKAVCDELRKKVAEDANAPRAS